MATTIQIKEITKQKLDRIRKDYETKLNKKLSYDETILLIIETSNNSFLEKQKLINGLFGILKGDTSRFKASRVEGETRLENFSKDH